jgi:hypothetical protein
MSKPDNVFHAVARPGPARFGTVIQVGKRGGRGFIIETANERYLITAAHCAGARPPAHAASYLRERTYANFIGPLGGDRNISGECVFIDPVAGLAVFGEPDNQAFALEAMRYQALIEAVTPFPLGKLRAGSNDAMVLSLNDKWFPCRVEKWGHSLWIADAAQPIRDGMFGSPIILPDGGVVGVVCVADGPNPALFACLPAWLASAAAVPVQDRRRGQRMLFRPAA